MLQVRNNAKILQKINSHINLISKNNINHGDVIHWFQQSPLHWFLILYVMKFYIEEVELSKNKVLDLINSNVMSEGKKTTTTEFKYINDAISKGYIISNISTNDARKKTLLPSSDTVEIMFNWFENYSE